MTTANAPLLASPPAIPTRTLFRQLLLLALPVIAEQLFHMVVGVTDTWLANNLPTDAAAASAAVGAISYLLWFIGLIVASVGTGSTALISRAKGARHKSLAASVCGQSVTAAFVLGSLLALLLYVFASTAIDLTLLPPKAHDYALSYLRMLAISIPFSAVMFIANACLRGAGDTLTPAIAMIVMDIVNVFFSFGLTYGSFGLPRMGFEGIAAGTVIAYIVGGVIQFTVLLTGRGGLRLHLHRMRPHWITLKRILRIGVPSGLEGLLTWIAQFSILTVINRMDTTSLASAAHINAVKIEGMSYLPGFGFAMAAATLTGQALGMKDPQRARRSTYLAFATGGSVMVLCGIVFILFGQTLARWMLPNQPDIAALTARCLHITGFIQAAFAASMIFSGALRGAGDTFAVMSLNLTSIICIRFAGVMIAVLVFHQGLIAVWIVLCAELVVRGAISWLRFEQGHWKKVEV